MVLLVTIRMLNLRDIKVLHPESIDVDTIPTQDPVCLSACGQTVQGTAFDQQWQREIALC